VVVASYHPPKGTNDMNEAKVGDRVYWYIFGPQDFVRCEGTITEIYRDKARVKESDGYHREHYWYALRPCEPKGQS